MDSEQFYANESFINTMILEEDRYIIRKARLDNLNNKAYNIEYRIVVEGETRWIHERAFPILDKEGVIIKSSGVCSDITAAKRDRELIDLQNRDINESIQYAMLIQEATLPVKADMDKVIQENFVLYRPKGMLSGDFFVFDYIKPESGLLFPAFVVADCTGHGVPGAILSILCSSLIKQSLTNHDVHSPDKALTVVKNELERLFMSHGTTQMKDGMDVAFCVLNPETKILSFAGANLGCYILRDGTWIELKGDKQHVGYSEATADFTLHNHSCQTGDLIYLFTDGFSDQFGGDKNKKYMRRKLLDFLRTVSQEPMNMQQDLLRTEFDNWKGDSEQTDDVCVLGARIA